MNDRAAQTDQTGESFKTDAAGEQAHPIPAQDSATSDAVPASAGAEATATKIAARSTFNTQFGGTHGEVDG